MWFSLRCFGRSEAGEKSCLWSFLFGLVWVFPPSLSLPFFPGEQAWDLQMGKQGSFCKCGRHLQSRASGVPASSEASSGKTALHIHDCFLRKARKGTREERKGAGSLFVSVSNMVSFDFSFSIVKGSPGILICYRLGCTCLPVWKLLSCCPGWGEHITSISLASTEPSACKNHTPRGAQRQVWRERPTLCIVGCSLC